MKKGQIAEGITIRTEFPNKGIVEHIDQEGQIRTEVAVKNALLGQKVSFSVKKMHKGRPEGILLNVIEKQADARKSPCPHFGDCGGCLYQEYPYEEQLKIKEGQIRELLLPVFETAEKNYGLSKSFDEAYEGILQSPREFGYRNKMEYTFGDAYKGGPLALGMHKRSSMYDIVPVTECKIADSDFGAILLATQEYFKSMGVPYYHRMSHVGYLRHLCIRKAVSTEEILVDLVTSSQLQLNLTEYVAVLNALKLQGTIVGILHTTNDNVADTVKNEGTEVLFGREFFYEKLLGLQFQITPFSFFQTNSLGAEVLYSKVREYLGKMEGDSKESVVFDLYSGTGTIAQLVAPAAGKVIGVEIVEEAVEAAKKNAVENNLNNCDFIAGDVLKVLDEISEKPDYIILDPPRDGIHPRALSHIISYGVSKIIYVSCKPTSLARDLEVFFGNGYVAERVCCVDMFPATANVETVVLLSKVNTPKN